MIGPDGSTPEGSDDRSISYKCNRDGTYDIPEEGFRKCLERRKALFLLTVLKT